MEVRLRSRFLVLIAVALAPAGPVRPASPTGAAEARPAGAPPAIAAPAVPAIAASAVLRGIVTSDESGRPLAGATVEVFDDYEPDEARAHLLDGDPIGAPLAHGRTDAAGRYRIEVRGGGRMVVVASATGRERRRCGRPFVPAGERDLGECALPEGRTIAGKVLASTGAPAARALVVARRAVVETGRWSEAGRSGRTVAFPAAARTDSAGRFTIEGAARSAVNLHVLATGAAPALLAGVRRDAGVEIRLAAGRTVSGLVVGPDGAPAPGAWALAGADGWDGLARADERGAFAIARVRSGATSLVALPADANPAAAAPGYAPSASVNVNVTADGTPPAPVVLKLRPGASVRVRLVDAATRLPIGGATATLARVEGAGSVRAPAAPGAAALRRAADGEGVARFAGVEPGTVSIAGEADGYIDAGPLRVEIAAGAERSITLAPARAAGIAGIVVDATEGKPIAGVPLVVLAEPPTPGRRGFGMVQPLDGVDPATTPADGRFAFDRLPPGRPLTVRVADPRFAPRDVAVAALAPGERRAGVEVRLARGAAITGRVVGPDGAPLAGAEVIAERQRDEDPTGGYTIYGPVRRAGGRSLDRRAPPRERQLPPTLTGVEGRYRLAGAIDGVWSLDIGAPGFAPHRVGGVRVEHGRDADAGEVTLVPGARVRGRVAGTAGEPIALARVAIWNQADWQAMDLITGADGRFESDDLDPAARVSVSVRSEGHARWQQDGVVPSLDEMAITLGPASSVSGRVIAADGHEPLTDFSISIARVVEVNGSGSSYSWMESLAERTFHAEDGSFSIDGLAPGRATVRAAAPGYRPAEKSDVTIPEGRALEGIVLALGRSATVSGTVADQAGAPVADVLVTRRTSDDARRARAGWEDAAAVSDADGAFTIGGLEPGTVTLDFAHPDYEPWSQEIDAAGDRQGLRVRLARAASLAGAVLRAPGGAPVGGATVQARPAGDSAYDAQVTATTGTDGRFVLAGITAGRYTVEAQAAGLRAGRVEGVIVERGVPPSPIEIRLEGGVTLRGRLLGVPEPERGLLLVTVFEPDGGTRGPAAVDAEGAFEIAGLAPGPSNLSFYRPAVTGFRVTRRVEIPAGVETHEVTLTIDEGRSVRGTVRRAGRPIGGARVDFWNRGRRVSASATADAEGAYRADRVAEGETQVSVTQFTLGIAYRREIVVDGDMTFDIDLPVATVEGIVREAGSARPLEGATVRAAPAAGSASLGGDDRTDAAGAWRIGGLEPGAHTLTARHAGHAFATRTVEVSGGDPEGSGGPGPVVFELEPASPLLLRIVDGVTGQPVRQVACLVLAGGGDPLDPAGAAPVVAFDGQLSAGADGEFRVDTLGPGAYRVVVATGELATETIHDLAVPGPTPTVTMAPAGSIRVRASRLATGTTARAVALDAAGRPMHLVAWTPLPFVTLRADGPSTLPNLRPGSYRLRAALPSGTVEVPVEVKAGGITDVTLP